MKERTGARGALLDEYEAALKDLKKTVKKISDEDLTKILDRKTKDENCRTIQNILSHVIICGYYNVIRILRHKSSSKNIEEKFPFPQLVKLNKISEYNKAIDEMFAFTEKSILN